MKAIFRQKKHRKELHPLYIYLKETEKKRKKDYEKFLEHTCERISVPKGVLTGQAEVHMLGNHCVRVCNYRYIELYSEESIKLSLGKKSLNIIGTHLLIEYFRKDEIKIIGNIVTVSFVL